MYNIYVIRFYTHGFCKIFSNHRLLCMKSVLEDGYAMDLRSEVKFDYMLNAISVIQCRTWTFFSYRSAIFSFSCLYYILEP